MKQSKKQTASDQGTVRIEPRTLKIRKLRWIDILNLLLIVLIVGYVAYAKLFPFNVIDVTNLQEGKIPMLTERVQAGTYAKYKIETQRHTDETITVIRSIVNGQTIPLSASLSNRPAGPGGFVVEILIPANLNPGKYHFRVCYELEKELDRKVTDCFETQDFEVYLPEGVDPDDDGITIPQDQNQIPIQSSPTDEESDPQSRVNLVEPHSMNPDNKTSGNTAPSGGGSSSSGGDASGRDEESDIICSLTGITVQDPLSLPIRIC